MPDPVAETGFNPDTDDHVVITIILPRKGGRAVGAERVEYIGTAPTVVQLGTEQVLAMIAKTLMDHHEDLARQEIQMQRVIMPARMNGKLN